MEPVPVLLPPNQLHRFYRGGARIAALRASGSEDPYAPEEWIASMASPFGEPRVGVSRLPDGRSLTEVIGNDPEAYLGPDHTKRFGADVAVLIKLLDAGERLPVHFHPDDGFATEHLGSRYGKTEAWIILEAVAGAAVHVGFATRVDRSQVSDWVERQEVDGMLGALNPVSVSPGDTLFVPAGTPHAIGEGILLAELQQPTDFSVLLEWKGFAVDGPETGHLGLGFDLALSALDLRVWEEDDLARCTETRRALDRAGVETLFPAAADAFFRAERIRPSETNLEPSFSVLLAVDGPGVLRGQEWNLELTKGDALLIPYAAGACVLDGDGEFIRCLPPAPSSAS